jgi:hypothetical protein
MKQETAVVMRLLTSNEQRLMNVLADVLSVSIDDACTDMVKNYKGDIDAYRVASIEHVVKDTKAGKRGPFSTEVVRRVLQADGTEVLDALRAEAQKQTDLYQVAVVGKRLLGHFLPGQRVRYPLSRTNVDGLDVLHGTVTADDGLNVTVEWDGNKHVGILTRGVQPADANRLQLDLDTLHERVS